PDKCFFNLLKDARPHCFKFVLPLSSCRLRLTDLGFVLSPVKPWQGHRTFNHVVVAVLGAGWSKHVPNVCGEVWRELLPRKSSFIFALPEGCIRCGEFRSVG